ncbi:hypothetical protein ACFOHS_02010 [Jhaorihella thermophila]
MAGGGLDRPHFCCAWPTGELGAMGLEGAVRLGFRDHLAGIADPEAREAEYRRLVDTLYERGKALNAASVLEFDAVIDPAETRAAIDRVLAAAGPGGAGARICGRLVAVRLWRGGPGASKAGPLRSAPCARRGNIPAPAARRNRSPPHG